MEILIKNKIILIDIEEWEKLKEFKWYIHTTNQGAQACITSDKSFNSIYMHRVILNAPKSLQVDHIDGDTLNNQKSNLRLVTNSQNQMNKKIHKNNKSGFKGVTWFTRYKKYRARININKKQIFLGHFSTKEEAFSAYLEAVKKYHGEYSSIYSREKEMKT